MRRTLRALALATCMVALLGAIQPAGAGTKDPNQARIEQAVRALGHVQATMEAGGARLVAVTPRRIGVPGSSDTVLFNEKTYQSPTCGDGTCMMRATPGLNGGGDFPLKAEWRLRTYRWISGVGWQLSTSDSITCNKCSMARDNPLFRWTYYGSVANAFDVTWTEPGAGHPFQAALWWSSMNRMSWRGGYNHAAHYWPCQTCGDLNNVNSTGYQWG